MLTNTSPGFRRTLFILLLLALCVFTSRAALADSLAQQSAAANGTASIASGAVNITSIGAPPLPWTSVDQDFHTNQAASAPANIGSTSMGSNTGCPVVDGWSASVTVINGGKTTASELPGCMLNILGQNIGLLKEIEVNGKRTFDGISVMRLETWCLYPLYKQAIENGMNFKCKATRDEEAKQRNTAVQQSVGAYGGNDQIVIDRMKAQGKL